MLRDKVFSLPFHILLEKEPCKPVLISDRKIFTRPFWTATGWSRLTPSPITAIVRRRFLRCLKRSKRNYGRPERFGVTGSVELDHFPTIDTAIAAVEANRFLKTGARHILGIVARPLSHLLDERGNYTEHSVNPLCASGTGSFLDQQAERIAVTTEELARRAEAFSGKTPSIATRCAVFAKSDITHAQAEGFTKTR